MPGVYVCTMFDDSRVRVGEGGPKRAEQTRREKQFDDVDCVVEYDDLRRAYLKEDTVWRMFRDAGLPVQSTRPMYTWFEPWRELTNEEVVETCRARGEFSREWWMSLSVEEHAQQCQKVSEALKVAWLEMSEEEYQRRCVINSESQNRVEIKERLRQVNLATKNLPEVREKYRLMNLGNTHSLGSKHSDETKRRISESAISRYQDPLQRQKTSEALRDSKVREKRRRSWLNLTDEQREERGRLIREGMSRSKQIGGE